MTLHIKKTQIKIVGAAGGVARFPKGYRVRIPNILCNDRIKQQRPCIGEQSIALSKCYLTTRIKSVI